MPKTVAIIGSHGLYAKYGGWDQLVYNLAHLKSDRINYLIFNSKESYNQKINPPPGVIVEKIKLSASGYEGLIYDFVSIIRSYFKCDSLLLLGAQGIPLIALLKILTKRNVVTNIGGVEWERPKFSYPAKIYLRFCFWLSFMCSDTVILDNEHYIEYVPIARRKKIKIIPYGGTISYKLNIVQEHIDKFQFLNGQYFLSISRSLEDNMLMELCSSFRINGKTLVLISNITKSSYGLHVLNKFKDDPNIHLIDGLYNKDELDLIRRNCIAYVHTHTLCGTAPSLVEMIMCKRPIFSIDVPQNRFTLEGQGCFFDDFNKLSSLVEDIESFDRYIPKLLDNERYTWVNVIHKYESVL